MTYSTCDLIIVFSDSTSHGLPRVLISKYSIVKIFWILAFLRGTVGASITFIQSIVSYYQYKTVVNVAFIQEFPTAFPAITICNLNPFLNLKKSPINDQEKLDQYVASLNSTEQQAIGFQLNNESLISCIFNNAICNETNDFSMFFDYNYGNCYTFNGGENKDKLLNTTLTGSNYGLTLEILTGNPNVFFHSQKKQGLLLVVHNQTQTLVRSIQLQNGITIPPGYNSYVAVRRNLHSQLPSPYSNCITSLTTTQKAVLLNYENYENISGVSAYDQASCNQLCHQIFVQNVCNCSDPKYPLINSTVTKCMNSSQLDCIREVNKQANNCGFDCPNECNTIDYSLLTSSGSYPSQYYVSILAKQGYLNNFASLTNDPQDMLESVQKYLVRVTVNYNQLGYTLYQDNPSLDINSLISTIGGQFGLFIGISILSIIEVFELLLELIWHYLKINDIHLFRKKVQ